MFIHTYLNKNIVWTHNPTITKTIEVTAEKDLNETKRSITTKKTHISWIRRNDYKMLNNNKRQSTQTTNTNKLI